MREAIFRGATPRGSPRRAPRHVADYHPLRRPTIFSRRAAAHTSGHGRPQASERRATSAIPEAHYAISQSFREAVYARISAAGGEYGRWKGERHTPGAFGTGTTKSLRCCLRRFLQLRGAARRHHTVAITMLPNDVAAFTVPFSDIGISLARAAAATPGLLDRRCA